MSKPTSRRLTNPPRTAAILSTEMLFVFPVIIILSLVTLQFILIYSGYFRIQAAAVAGAELAAGGSDVDTVHAQAGLVLGAIVGDYETKMQYVDADGDFGAGPGGTIEENDDYVAVAVRMPMAMLSTNYLGLLGGSINDLHVNAAVCRIMLTDVVIPP